MIKALLGTRAKTLVLGSFNLGWAYEVVFPTELGENSVTENHMNELKKLIEIDGEFAEQNWGIAVVDGNGQTYRKSRI